MIKFGWNPTRLSITSKLFLMIFQQLIISKICRLRLHQCSHTWFTKSCPHLYDDDDEVGGNFIMSADYDDDYSSEQSVTYRYRAFPVPGMFHFLVVSEPVPEKVSEPVSEKFGTGKKSRNRYRKNLVPEKGLGTGIGKIWYRKKVSEPVSEKFDTRPEFRRQNLGI